MPTPMKLVAAGLTNVGRVRDHNEDNYRIVDEEGLYVVCDGMGGHASGEVASEIACDEIVKFISETSKVLGLPVSSDGLSPEEVALSEAVKAANEAVFFRSIRDKSCAGMGTTLVAMLEAEENLVLAHVGDSRIYRLRDGIFSQITEDHSLLNHLIQTQGLSEEEIANFENKNVILRAVGLKDSVDVETQVTRKFPGDIYLLCSDGLSDMVDDREMGELLLARTNELEEACRVLVEAANRNGGHDNITVILLRVMVEVNPTPVSRPLNLQ